ncbi:MAG: NRDE family protein [Saprospiraceae bacterium]|nr:NRDE family protein [Saprospiraceae bacterium]
MCTVTYIPKGKDNFILTSNRDEQATRSPRNLSIVEGDTQLVFPRDGGAGGTWIAMSDSDKVLCILNGAFERHERKPNYRMSRGIMALEFFEFDKAEDFFERFDFRAIEPFTMVAYDQGNLFELRWDEQVAHIKELSANEHHIWSSATLYEASIRAKREEWFANWLEGREDFDLPAILDFHHHAGEGDPWNDVIMNRGYVQTVSVTSIVKTPDSAAMLYHDLLREELKQAKIELNKNLIGIVE